MSIQNITNNQMSEIEQKLKMERDMKMDIINSASSQRNSISPDAHKNRSETKEWWFIDNKLM